MSLQAPAWINADFLQSILKKSESDNSIEVTHVATKGATSNGDNYLSDMIRVTVEYSRDNCGHRKREQKSLIFKIAPTEEGANKDIVTETGAFRKEIKMMEETLVKMNELLNNEEYRLSARAVYTELGDPSFIVMEDMAPLGYRMADRRAGLDLQHSLLAIRGMARYHASSVALYEKNPKALAMYTKGVIHGDSPEPLKRIIIDPLPLLGKEILNWPELGSSARTYSEKLLKLSKVSFARGIEACTPKDDEFNVLNHGDMWSNNILFRYNSDGKVTGQVFVDFQMGMWASPACDILHFLNSSTSEDVELHHYPTLLREYLKVLTETMTRLRCKTKPPTMSDLEKMLNDRGVLEVIWTTVALPLSLIDRNEATSFDEIVRRGDDYVNPVYKEMAYRKAILRRLLSWTAKGLLDL